MHWHGDTFDLPHGAVHLAATLMSPNQAFTWGKRTLALQCHLEVTTQGLERWWIGQVEAIRRHPGISLPQLRRDTQRYAPRLAQQAMRCWDAWLDDVLTEEVESRLEEPGTRPFFDVRRAIS